MNALVSGLREDLTANTVHLCVDMQRLFSTEGPWSTPWMDRTLPAIAALAELVPERTVFTRFIPPRDATDLPGVWQRYYARWREVTRRHLDARLLELVQPLAKLVPPATIVDKQVYSPFAGSSLLPHLRQRNVDALVVTGAETDVCVLATVLGAVDLGFRVIVVADAVCSSSDAGHEAMMTLYGKRFSEQIELANVEEVSIALRKSASRRVWIHAR